MSLRKSLVHHSPSSLNWLLGLSKPISFSQLLAWVMYLRVTLDRSWSLLSYCALDSVFGVCGCMLVSCLQGVRESLVSSK